MGAVCSGTGLDLVEEGKGKAAGHAAGPHLGLQAAITLLTSPISRICGVFFPKGWTFLWLDEDAAQLRPFRRVSAVKSEGWELSQVVLW